MKKIILTIFLSGILITINAQTKKGDWLIGGRVDVNTGDNSSHIGFTPNAGYFLINNFAIGGNIMIDYDKREDNKVTNLGIGPFARLYFPGAKAKPLLQGSVGYSSRQLKSPSFSSTDNGVSIFLGGGVAAFINENVAIEIITGYTNTKYKNSEGGFYLGIGFQVYLSKKQVESIKVQ